MRWLINITDDSHAAANISLQCDDEQHGAIFVWKLVTMVFAYILGFPAAVAILADMFQKGRKGTPFTPNDVFILNLTVMDMIYLCFLQPQLYQNERDLVLKAFFAFFYSFNLCGRPLFITCISLDCYLAVVHPVVYRARKSLTPRILMAVGVWTVTVSYGCYFATALEASAAIIPVLFILLTFPVIGFCDFSILWTLKRSSPGGRDIHPQKKRALHIIFTNLSIAFISYLPPVIILFVSEFLRLAGKSIESDCLVIPAMYVTVVGNAVSLILHLNNLGKLDRLKCWKQKLTFSLCLFSF